MLSDILKAFLYDNGLSIYHSILNFVEELILSYTSISDYGKIEEFAIFFTIPTIIFLSLVMIYVFYKIIYVIVRWIVKW